MLDYQKRRIQFVGFVVGVVVLSITAEKCRQLVGEEASSQSGQFTILNCFDMGSGSVACGVKEGIKLYFYNIRSAHVEMARNKAIEVALVDATTQGLAPNLAAKYAQKEGEKAAKLVTRKAKRIVGPIISSGWDFFEAVYYGGTIAEGSLRGVGTLFGAYGGGFLGEQQLGRVGYLVGSHLGSWVGGRIGLMVYDVVNGVHFLLQFSTSTESSEDSVPYESSTLESSEDSVSDESPTFESSEDYSATYESPTSDGSEDSVSYESPTSDSYETISYESPSSESSEESEGAYIW
ncbi:unnamed protein product [Rhodiola kirilowii]